MPEINPRLRQRNGPRALAAANIARLAGSAGGDLDPGYMRLYTHCIPSLLPGSYGIEAKQVIETSLTAPEGRLNVWNYDSQLTTTYPPPDNTPVVLQNFEVVAPRFQIDPKAIRSKYPPDGFTDDATVLPHIVFNDPFLPWTWSPTFARERNALPVPWLALLVFTPEELRVDATETADLGISVDSVKAVTTSGAYPMTVGDYLSNITSRSRYEENFADLDNNPAWAAIKASPEKTNIIFPTSSRVDEIISPWEKFILMCHVRELNTIGFPDSGVEDKGRYSVCVSHMTGKPDVTAPTPHVVHLVSIEHLGRRRSRGGNPSARLGLVSLYSWNYLVVPRDPVNFKDTMLHLATTKGPLRPSNDILGSIPAALEPSGTDVTGKVRLLRDRLSLGYSINRWRASTGEETVAFSRGPLTPAQTPWVPISDWPSSSNTGKDYQILDTKLGMLDLSYSSAWQLGKLLAISDSVFSAALLRFRGVVHKWAADNTRVISNGLNSRSLILTGVTGQAREVRSAVEGHPVPARNILPTQDPVAPFVSHPRIKPLFRDALSTAVTTQAASGQHLYNDYMLGSADNSDWEILHAWISDKLFLGGIPAHYLITDPVHLPSESLRFFYVDKAWIDCFIDGALSTSNHFEPEVDSTRKIIKEVYNVYLQNIIQPAAVKPPVPRYGFFLRSEIIRVMPDIRIVVRCRKVDPNGALVPEETRLPLVRLTRMNDNTIFALLDCMPEDLFDIRFIQPPHQQKFVKPTKPRQLYSRGAPTVTDSGGSWEPIPPSRMPTDGEIQLWYNQDTQCLDVLRMYGALVQALPFRNPIFPLLQGFNFGDWPNQDGPIDSTVIALELNDVSYELTIQPPNGSSPSLAPSPDRQLWTGDNLTASAGARIPTRALPFHTFAGDARLWSEMMKPKFNISSLRSAKFLLRRKIPTISQQQPGISLPKSIQLTARNATPANLLVTLAAAANFPLIPTANPQFQLTVHLSTRGASASVAVPAGSDPIYSAWNNIPTNSKRYINLIFSLHRTPAATPFPYRLSSILITVPAISASAAPNASGEEPLLRLPDTNNTLSARMLANKRFAATLALSTAAVGGQREVHITLSPKQIPVTQTGSLGDEVSQDASFVLRMCDVAPVVTAEQVLVLAPGGSGGGTVAEQRGRCEMQVAERYLMDDGSVGEVQGTAVVWKKSAAE